MINLRIKIWKQNHYFEGGLKHEEESVISDTEHSYAEEITWMFWDDMNAKEDLIS